MTRRSEIAIGPSFSCQRRDQSTGGNGGAAPGRTAMRTKWSALLASCISALSTSGCYLVHVASGHVRLLCGRQPVAEVLAEPTTPDAVRERLLLVDHVRRYAEALGLDVGSQYTSYVPWPGDRIVTTVVATRPGEIEPFGFYFPIVGRVPYKGLFDRDRARAEAERLRGRGLDVCEVAVPAYSTLGWFDDPITGPMLRRGEGELVETVVHELVHATFFVRSRPDFNEGVAAFIGEEASVRFFAWVEPRDAAASGRQRARVRDGRLIAETILTFRRQLASLSESASPAAARSERRTALEADARAALAALPLSDPDASELARRSALNDACLALAGTYAGDTQAYVQRLAVLDGDLRAFVALARSAAETDDPRAALLEP